MGKFFDSAATQARTAELNASTGAQQKEAIKIAIAEARDEGFPTNTEDKEAYFMSEVGRGESLCQEGTNNTQPENGIPSALLTNSCRIRPDRSRTMLLQGAESVSGAWRPDKHLR